MVRVKSKTSKVCACFRLGYIVQEAITLHEGYTEGSLFCGIDGFGLAAEHAGMRSVWKSEIEPFPISVSKRHFPNATHLGNVAKVDGRSIQPVDIITFGSPCQDLSVAGKREGIEGDRSSLFYEATRIISEMRRKTNGCYPRFAVWENVPGALSSNKGEDFRSVIEELVQIAQGESVSIPRPKRWTRAGVVRGEGWSLAWRILDAQFFGVPQRRRRVFVVVDFADRCASKVLFEREGVRGDSTQSAEARQGASADASGISRIDCSPNGISEAVCSKWHEGNGGPAGDEHYNLVIAPQLYDMTHADEVIREVSSAVSPTLNHRMGTGGNQIPILLDATAYAIDCRNLYENEELSGTLQAKPYRGGMSLSYQNPIRINHAVRRLTPVECERLQGFPDDWTAGGSDTSRYKALGNAVAVPVVQWLMRRLHGALVAYDASKGVDSRG